MNAGDLLKALLKPKIKVGTEVVTQGRNKDQVSITFNSDHTYIKVYISLHGLLNYSSFDRLYTLLVPWPNPFTIVCSNGLLCASTRPLTPRPREITTSVSWISLVSKSST